MTNIARDVNDCVKQLMAENEAKSKTIEILQKALFIGGRYARENIPAEFPKKHTHEYMDIIIGGVSRDPSGLEFVDYWLKVARAK